MISGFLALLDDLAIILDDVAVMTKLAAKKSAGVLGDDLALNAKQMVGLDPNKELKVIYQIFKGALKNKLWLVPGAIGLSAISIKIIQVILVIGAIYLCFEGTEKIVDYLEHKINKFKGIYDQKNKHIDQLREKIKNAETDILAYEKDKIKSAIRTDMILSVEVIAITLAIVGSKPIIIQFFTVAIIALLMTVFIYGIVAAIVRIDDVGFWLMARKNKASRWLGQKMIYNTAFDEGFSISWYVSNAIGGRQHYRSFDVGRGQRYLAVFLGGKYWVGSGRSKYINLGKIN